MRVLWSCVNWRVPILAVQCEFAWQSASLITETAMRLRGNLSPLCELWRYLDHQTTHLCGLIGLLILRRATAPIATDQKNVPIGRSTVPYLMDASESVNRLGSGHNHQLTRHGGTAKMQRKSYKTVVCCGLGNLPSPLNVLV